LKKERENLINKEKPREKNKQKYMKKKKVQGTFLITSHMLTGTKEEKD
jgi:hypothetical protein